MSRVVVLDLGDEEGLQALADAVADRLASKLPARAESGPDEPDGWLRPEAAAAYLGVRRHRIHDLTSSGALVPDGRDGRTPLYRRSTLDAYARS